MVAPQQAREPRDRPAAANKQPVSKPRSLNVGIIVNPKHVLTQRAYADLVEELRTAAVHYRSLTTSVERSGGWQAEELIDWGADAVIILGGDGTIRAAAPELAESTVLTFLVPTGTANVLSRHLGLRSSRHAIEHCLSTLASITHDDPGTTRSIPINFAEFRRIDGSRQHTEFISLAGIGGDARAVAHHHGAPGLLGYALGAARALFAPDLRLRTRDIAAGPVWSVMASKVSRPAGPIAVFPHARIDAETFSGLTVGPLPRTLLARGRAWAGIAAACLQGRPEAHPLMNYRSTTDVAVAVETPAPAQLDGDLIGDCLELRVGAGEKTLQVSAPTA